MIKRMSALVLCLSLLLSSPLTAQAANKWASEPTYSDQAIGKLKFGLKNLLMSWTELIREPANANNLGDNVLSGFGHGLIKAFSNTLLGALHTVTFPITAIDVPLVDDGTDLL